MKEILYSNLDTARAKMAELKAARAGLAAAEQRGEATSATRSAVERVNEQMRETAERIRDLEERTAEVERIDQSVDLFEQRVGRISVERPSPVAVDVRALVDGRTGGITLPVFEQRDSVVLTAGGTTDGKELVPVRHANDIYRKLVAESPVLGLVNALFTDDGADLVMPRFTSYSVASLVDENTEIGVDAPQFDTVAFRSYKMAFLAKMTRELLADSQAPVYEAVLEQGLAAVSRGMATYVVTGSGTGQPQGVDNATVGKTLAADNAITVEELIDTVHSVLPEARGNAVWLLNDATVAKIRKLRYDLLAAGDSLGQYVWEPSAQAGTPERILGYPVFIEPNIAALDGTNDAVVGVFGDLNRGVTLRMAGGIDVSRSDDFEFHLDRTAVRFVVRFDSRIVGSEAVRTIKTPAA